MKKLRQRQYQEVYTGEIGREPVAKQSTKVRFLKETFKLTLLGALAFGGFEIGGHFFREQKDMGRVDSRKNYLAVREIFLRKPNIIAALMSQLQALEVSVRDKIITRKTRPIRIVLFKDDPDNSDQNRQTEAVLEFEGYTYLDNTNSAEGNVWFNTRNQVLVEVNAGSMEMDSLNCEKIGVNSACLNGYYLFDFTERAGVIENLKVSILIGEEKQAGYKDTQLTLTNKTAVSGQIEVNDDEIKDALTKLIKQRDEAAKLAKTPIIPDRNSEPDDSKKIRDEQKIVALDVKWVMKNPKANEHGLCAGFVSGPDTLVTAGHCLYGSEKNQGKLVGISHVLLRGEQVGFGKFWSEYDSGYVIAFSGEKDFAVVAFQKQVFKNVPQLTFSAIQISPTSKMFFPRWYGENYDLHWRIEQGQAVLARTDGISGFSFPLKLDFKAQKGNSGGPLLDDQGKVIGVASFMTEIENGTGKLCLDRITKTDFEQLEKTAKEQFKKPRP